MKGMIMIKMCFGILFGAIAMTAALAAWDYYVPWMGW